ncbi:MAG: hypothetical protein RMN25_03100 [Anaerolineae bacterium]|nr:hypothetical protein [Thermoflexales bacterium]MDW8406745.1 hypothetical protein [Anaerolineae bacterium]
MPARIQQPSEQPLKRAPEPLPLVRRSTRVSRIQRATETTNVTSSASEVHSEKASQARQPDLHTLAYQVYPILKRMLAVERERLRGF